MSNQENKVPKSPKDQKTIEERVRELDEQVEWFYGDDFQLDQAIQNYQKTAKLAEEIEQDLLKLQNEVKVIGDLTK